MTSMDIVYLHGIEVDCVIGVWDWERQINQRIIIDLDVGRDLQQAAATDQLKHTLDYQGIAMAVRRLCVDRQANLLETLATEIAQTLLSEFDCHWCRIKINKPGAVRHVAETGVIIERTKA